MVTLEDREFMAQALEQARAGAEAGEVPVGAVITVASGVVARAHNRPIGLSDATAHAELLAIRAACAKLGSYRLNGAALYVTLEPCVMCVGAIINARIARLFFGCRDQRAGAAGSVYDIGRDARLNHSVEIYAGLMAEESSALLQEFFRSRR